LSIVASFEIPYTQFINEKSERVQDLPEAFQDPQHLLSLYKMMALVRAFDARAVAMQRTGKMGTYAASLGQEAISVAIGSAMKKDDVLVPTYREYGAQLQRGVKIEDILNYWGGNELGSCFDNKEDFPICVPLATQCLHAAGIAKAIQLRKEKRAVVCVVGDGATSEGNFYEAINVAGAWHLPVIFVVINNQWAISVPRNIQSGAQTMAQKALAGGLPGEQVDGNDVLAVEYAVKNALEKARAGLGPHLIEAITYRLCDHTTADDASRYRAKEEVDAAWEKEPVKRFREFLINQKIWDEKKEKALVEKYDADVLQAAENFLKIKPQAPESMFDYLFETLPTQYIEQREALLAKVAGDF
jgi:2-oxoisovalerate dehydrogenase E1 component alpha subunit